MTVNGVVLIGLVALVVAAVGPGPGAGAAKAKAGSESVANVAAGAPATGATGPGGVSVPGAAKYRALPTKQDLLTLPGHYFGVSAPDVPWSSEDLDKITTAAGVSPNLTEYFVNWKTDFDLVGVASAYKHGALPMISWEPWGGSKGGTTKQDAAQPDYALRNIVSGKFDPYITKFAAAVHTAGVPVAIRFAHEMNGTWYPWSEGVNGNKKGEYAAAWRHVHDLFAKAGADNVVWIWSPNNLEGASAPLHELYPGDAYVDWIGLSAYLTVGNTPAKVIDPALKAIRAFTAKRFIVTETGAEPGPTKAARISALFTWLDAHPDVIGFVWFETTKATGAGADWRFDADPASEAGFGRGITKLALAKVPVIALL